MPSIRKLAADAQVSVITVKRAYDDLEAEGFLETVPARGTFVAVKNPALFRERRLREIEADLGKILEKARAARVSKEEILSLMEILYSEENNGKRD
jgi:GntR family transcriptional regulator